MLRSLSIGSDFLYLEWDCPRDAQYFAIAIRSVDTGYNWKLLTTSLHNDSYTVTGLRSGLWLDVLVQPWMNGQWNTTSQSLLVNRYIQAGGISPIPQNVTVNAYRTTARVKWTAVPGATRYAVSLYKNGRYYVQNANITDTKYMLTGLTPNQRVEVLVQALVSGKWSSDHHSLLMSDYPWDYYKPLSPDVWVKASRGGTEIEVSWDGFDTTERYAISLQEMGVSGIRTLTTNYIGSSYTITGLNRNREYFVLVQGYQDGRWSEDLPGRWKRVVTSYSPPVMKRPYIFKRGEGWAGVEWEVQPGIERYAVSALIDGSYRVIDSNISPETTSYLVKNLPLGKTCHILVQAYADGAWSSDAAGNTVPVFIPNFGVVPSPTWSSISSTANTISVNVGYVNPEPYSMNLIVEKYAVSLRENGAYRVIDSNIPRHRMPYTITGLKPDTLYAVLVQAHVAGKWSSDNPLNVLYIKTKPSPQAPTPPTFRVATNYRLGNSLYINWNEVKGAARYAVSILEDNGSYRVINADISASQSSYIITGLTNWKQYWVLMQAQVDGRWSSDSISVTRSGMPKPVQLPAPDWDMSTPIFGTVKISIYTDPLQYSHYAIAIYEDGRYRVLTSNFKGKELTIYGLAVGNQYTFLVQGYHKDLKMWTSDQPQYRQSIRTTPH